MVVSLQRSICRIGAAVPSLFFILLCTGLASSNANANPDAWRHEWPNTDFSRHSVDFGEILSGGPPKDGIPPLDDPVFVPLTQDTGLSATEPVIGLQINGVARAYPLRVLTWHEIVNDIVGGVPVAITYCPLCNAAIVFRREVDGRLLDFGTTGKLRHSDLIMYDRQTESWWQQFIGEAIVGAMTGKRLDILPARLESYANFAARRPGASVLVPNNPDFRPYGANPYVGYDSSGFPFLYRGEVPKGVTPLQRVVVIGNMAWTLDLLRQRQRIETGDIVITWAPGQNSALDSQRIEQGRDVGNVVVQRQAGGLLVDIPYDVTFAFVFHAFKPDGTILVD